MDAHSAIFIAGTGGTASVNATDDDVAFAYGNNEMKPWLEKELLQEINSINHDNEDVKTYTCFCNWRINKAIIPADSGTSQFPRTRRIHLILVPIYNK